MRNASETNLIKEGLKEGKICLCPVKGIIDILSKKWTLLIIVVIGNHKTIRFNKIMGQFEGINPKTLSQRLKELEKANLIARKAFAEVPLRVEYSLSKEGRELIDAIIPLMEWATKKDTQEVTQ
ncbi:MAG: helix-turn-helix transcriptional regulator [Candidatus Heimdallarchaeota archaeon]|nr:helix-turn-helix transcriptional regulator [Candidatus Heimdallarchaeota archaeon]MBY8993155.1 helix-turn-helix transcriptional regulator [Candidatus Heimdallarchaeota archaeon]